MATLTWIDALTGFQLVGGPVRQKPGNVILRDWWAGGVRPELLEVMEARSRWQALRAYIWGERPLEFDVPVSEMRGEVSESSPLSLGAGRFPGQTAWIFRDRANRAWSGPVVVTSQSVGVAVRVREPRTVKPGVALSLAGLKVEPNLAIGSGGTTTLSGTVGAILDPLVELRVLQLGRDGGLVDAISEGAKLGRDQVEEALIAAWGIEAGLSDSGWGFELSTPRLELGEGRTEDFEVTVRAGEGLAAFAVEARAAELGEPGVLSDLVVVRGLGAQDLELAEPEARWKLLPGRPRVG